jgi:hypothetical protein
MEVRLRWTSKGSRSYRVQSSTDLQSWQFLSSGAIFGQDGPQTSLSVPISSQRLFFRIIPLKPPAGE